MPPLPHRRTRMVPEARRDLILDVTAQLVTTEGVSAVSMERVGREAQISKALVYNYFPSRNLLLQALLMRENRAYQIQQIKAAETATDLETMVRATTRAYLDQVAAKGVLIERLMGEPAIAEAMGEIELIGRQQAIDYLLSRINADKALSAPLARMMVEVGLGITGAGGAYLDRTGCDIDLLEDMVVDMILASLRVTQERQHLWRKGPEST
ncbi:MAG: TetR/AcrR family transcriptional regulator [Hyphomonadaceae bacterium]|uniref:TetR/AcrR family transcriptional regulator n=1 Tax=Aquidulcibacter sp. TaxID=2052990 RepID=UPI0022CB1B3B|nr:TetR/AcrR family transcriptional regulator [Aquidulcibacter sp.]MCE2891497.1 TetR/AcrR family transcriptional regulator [Hyphomonadaceae bacterium]MCZ8210170.1 TetR/AcrR family transcriptional regulator [Aquidulcibacter sp.]